MGQTHGSGGHDGVHDDRDDDDHDGVHARAWITCGHGSIETTRACCGGHHVLCKSSAADDDDDRDQMKYPRCTNNHLPVCQMLIVDCGNVDDPRHLDSQQIHRYVSRNTSHNHRDHGTHRPCVHRDGDLACAVMCSL